MLPESEISEYGGKGAILNHVRDNLPDMPIPKYILINPHDINSLSLRELDNLREPLIIRSSSPHEYGDFEGIFESVKDVTRGLSFAYAIKSAKESAMSERAKIYAEQNGFEISDDMRIIVQEQSDSKYCGAMMRHPNNQDLIFITMYGLSDERYQRTYNSFLFDEKTHAKKYTHNFLTHGIEEKDAQDLVEKYKQIESLKSIADGYGLFVEFGFEPFQLYQVRPFKKIETADFELPEVNAWRAHNDKDFIKTDLVFGITPKEGIALPLIRSLGISEAEYLTNNRLRERDGVIFEGYDDMLLTNINNARYVSKTTSEFREHASNSLMDWNIMLDGLLGSKPYCFMTSAAHRESYDVDLTIPNMRGLIVGEVRSFLVHGLIRLIKKADVSILDNDISVKKFFKQARSVDDKVRIISNGKEALVLKE